MAMLIDGKSEEQKFPISDGGVLMKRRLKCLLMNQVGVQREDDHRDIHVIGPIWRAPYALLRELIDERVQLQEQLAAIGNAKIKLSRIPRREVPEKTSSGQITMLMRKELELIERLQDEIAIAEEVAGLVAAAEERVRNELTAELKAKYAGRSVEPNFVTVAPPYSSGGGWDIH